MQTRATFCFAQECKGTSGNGPRGLFQRRAMSWPLNSEERLFGVSILTRPHIRRNSPKEYLASQELGFLPKEFWRNLESRSLQIPSSQTDLQLVIENSKAVPPLKRCLHLLERKLGNVDVSRSDEAVVRWLQREEQLFRALERMTVEKRLEGGFRDVYDFVAFSLSVNNRRKSRLGNSWQMNAPPYSDSQKFKYKLK